MKLIEEKIDGEEIFSGHVIRVCKDHVRLPNGSEGVREIIRHRGAVCIVPVDNDGYVYMVRQFRYAVGKELLELPAGKLEKNEDILEAAKRELPEETGLSASKWTSLGEMYAAVGYSDEVIYVYLAEQLEFGEVHPDDDEFIDVEKFKLEDLSGMIMDGRIRDSKTVFGILKAEKLLQKS